MVQRRPHNTLPIHHASSPRHRARRRAYLDAALKLGVALLALRGLASLRPARPVDDDAPLAGSAREKRTKPQTRSAHFAIPAAASHLVVVAGHAVTMGEDLSAVARTDRDWYLLDYQRDRGAPRDFVNHIERGVAVAARDPNAVLVFSGGQTRRDAGPRSEAQSYWLVAEHFDWWRTNVGSRATTEEYARDSLENVLFAICRFKEVAGAYPSKVTVVSFDFKGPRFAELHAGALQLLDAFSFEGVAPGPRFDNAAAAAGEAATRDAFLNDPFGCGADLASKKATRDPFSRTAPYAASCPELRPLFDACNASRPADRWRAPWAEPTEHRRFVHLRRRSSVGAVAI